MNADAPHRNGRLHAAPNSGMIGGTRGFLLGFFIQGPRPSPQAVTVRENLRGHRGGVDDAVYASAAVHDL
jgi:hypothetical protein